MSMIISIHFQGFRILINLYRRFIRFDLLLYYCRYLWKTFNCRCHECVLSKEVQTYFNPNERGIPQEAPAEGSTR